MDRTKLIADLKKEEGFVSHVYKDSLGYFTIGYGRMVDKRLGGGLDEKEADYLLNNDIDKVEADLRHFLPWYDKKPDHVKRALCNMCFQMGINKLCGFTNTLDYIRRGMYDRAAENALKSKWARQTPERAKRVTDLLKGKGE